MALSEHEQRLLDEMERNLYQNDADFVAPGTGGRLNYGALTLGVLIALAGLGLVIVGVVIRIPLLGIAGFAVMFAGVLVAMRRSADDAPEPPAGGGTPPSAGQPPRQRGSFMSNLEDRWDRRRDDRD